MNAIAPFSQGPLMMSSREIAELVNSRHDKVTVKTIRICIENPNCKQQPFWLSVVKSAVFSAILFGPGILAESPAMQWAGFIVLLTFSGMAWLVAMAEGMSIEQARKKLDALEAAGRA